MKAGEGQLKPSSVRNQFRHMHTKGKILGGAALLLGLAHSESQPIITNQPQSLTNIAGTTAVFSVGAGGTEPLSYQWQHYSSWLQGETNASLTLTNVQSITSGDYSVIVTNIENAVTSSAATLTVLFPPHFIFHPTNQSVSLGANVPFGFYATGTPPLYYFLQFQQTNVVGGVGLATPLRLTLLLTNVQIANEGDYVFLITNIAGSATSHVAHLDVDPAFTKITTGSIVTDVGTGTACAWGDYDGDGFLDLIITSAYNPFNNTPQKNLLFHNNGNGTFTKVSNTVITTESRDWRGCAWVDYDNDGKLDLFVTSTDFDGFSSQNELFRNNGDGTFTKMTSVQVGALVPGGGGSEGPVFADYDRDGFIDVYIARYSNDWLFHNNGDATFTGIPNTNGIPVNYEDGYRAMWADFNNDGWPDLFVPVNTPSPCAHAFLYQGIGAGLFTNITSGSIVTSCSFSAAAWADYDNDGYLDLFLVASPVHPNLLYHNNGDGTFTSMPGNVVGPIASLTGTATDCAWGDYDNDGFLDLFLSTYPVTAGGLTTNYLYHNNGNGTFSQVLTGSLVNDKTLGAVSCIWGDYDNDGFLDLFVPCGADLSPSTNLLYRNNGNSNAWLKIKLVGTASNRSAIGAKVRLLSTIRGRAMWQLREINTGTGFSGCPLEAHFGLGDATNIDEVRIEWPSGIVQILTNVAPRQFLTVTEHQQTATIPTPPLLSSVSRLGNSAVDMSASGDPGLLYVFEASTDLLNWTKVGVRSNATGIVSFTDARNAAFGKRFYRVSIP